MTQPGLELRQTDSSTYLYLIHHIILLPNSMPVSSRVESSMEKIKQGRGRKCLGCEVELAIFIQSGQERPHWEGGIGVKTTLNAYKGDNSKREQKLMCNMGSRELFLFPKMGTFEKRKASDSRERVKNPSPRKGLSPPVGLTWGMWQQGRWKGGRTVGCRSKSMWWRFSSGASS